MRSLSLGVQWSNAVAVVSFNFLLVVEALVEDLALWEDDAKDFAAF